MFCSLLDYTWEQFRRSDLLTLFGPDGFFQNPRAVVEAYRYQHNPT